MKIAIDAGHGGIDVGATTNATVEKTLNFEIANIIGEVLTSAGYEVLRIREKDTYLPLAIRASMSNVFQADLFFSVHCNSFHFEYPHGVQTYYYNFSTKGKKLAKKLSDSLNCKYPYELKWSRSFPANFTVLRMTDAVAVLIECGFMSNKKDLALLKTSDWQAKIAQSVLEVVRDF